MLPRAAVLVSNGNNILTSNFARFAANKMTPKANKLPRKTVVTTQPKLNVKPGHQTFVAPYSTDNRGEILLKENYSPDKPVSAGFRPASF